MYVHGLGDAQERLADEYEAQYGWMSSIKIICPKCKSENCEWEDYEEDYHEYGIDYEFNCWCNECEHTFTFYYES